MKTHFLRIGHRVWAMLLVVVMVLSAFSATAITLDKSVAEPATKAEAQSVKEETKPEQTDAAAKKAKKRNVKNIADSGRSADVEESGGVDPSSNGPYWIKVLSSKNDFTEAKIGAASNLGSHTTGFGTGSGYLSTQTLTISAGTYNLVLWDMGNSGENRIFASDMSISNSGDLYFRDKNNKMNDKPLGKLTITSSGQYKVTVKKSGSELKVTVAKASDPLCDSITATRSAASYPTGSTAATVTATVTGGKLSGSQQYKFQLYRGTSVIATQTITASALESASRQVTFTNVLDGCGVGSYNFYVKISSNETSSSGGTYEPKNSNTVSISVVKTSDVYYAKSTDGNLPTGSLTQVTSDEVTLINDTSGTTGNTYSVVFYDHSTASDIYNINDVVIGTQTLATITKVKSGARYYYTIQCTSVAANAKVKYNKTTNTLSVVCESVSADIGNVFDATNSEKKVTYYFAEDSSTTGTSLSGSGVRIKYWNNTQYNQNSSKLIIDATASNGNWWITGTYYTEVYYYMSSGSMPALWAKAEWHDGVYYAPKPEGYDMCILVRRTDGHKASFDGANAETKPTNISDSSNTTTVKTYDKDSSGDNKVWTVVSESGSYSDSTTKINVTDAAYVTGSTTDNDIKVQASELYRAGFTGTKTFNVYKISLPVWATSFAFCYKDTNYAIQTDNTISASGRSHDDDNKFGVNGINSATLALNSNRIYLLYKGSSTYDKYYCRGVVLDDHIWSSSSTTNWVDTKTFNSSAVNYNTSYGETYDGWTKTPIDNYLSGNQNASSIDSNEERTLSKIYQNKSYADPLYFGLFNYYRKNAYDSDGSQQNKTTFKTKLYNFQLYKNSAYRNDNGSVRETDERYYFASTQSLVSNKLGVANSTGYKQLLGSDSANMILFDYDNMNSNIAGSSYVKKNLKFPFNKSSYNGITTYSFDSTTDYNRRIDNNEFKVSSQFEVAPLGDNNGLGFFPFITIGSTTNYNNYYGYGMEFDIDFYMSPTGGLEDALGDMEDITFNFSGDDDVWVYIDGVLALDLGGDHKISAGSINFTEMKVYYRTAVIDKTEITDSGHAGASSTKAVDTSKCKVVDLKKLLAGGGVNFDNTDNVTKHTLQMFYMERGCLDSNCSISFNLPQTTTLAVRNEVDVDGVNDGLRAAAERVTDTDYFTYTVNNRLATAAEKTSLASAYTNIVTGDGTAVYSKDQPYYPYYNPNNAVNRETSYFTRLLAPKDNTTMGASPETPYYNGMTDSAWKLVASTNYVLKDDYATVYDSDSASADKIVGSGKTHSSTGEFGLLYGQTAAFEYKIKQNSVIKVTQTDVLKTVSTDSAANGSVTIPVSSDPYRSVRDYYTTAYDIYDNFSESSISNADAARELHSDSTNGISATDAANVLTDSFFFSNYKQGATTEDSTSMRVTFKNRPNTEKIIITKEMAEGDTSEDTFTFTLNFTKVFGDSSPETLAKIDLSKLVYRLYNNTTNDYEEREYGTGAGAGIKFDLEQHVEILGIPVDTAYELTEAPQGGYKINDVETNVTNVNVASDTLVSADTSYNVTGTIPTFSKKDDISAVSSTDPSAKPSDTEVKFTNINDFTITFKYYDREVVSGTVAHINEEPTVANVIITRGEMTANKHANSDQLEFGSLIRTAFGKLIQPENVVDEYILFTSQANALSQIKSQPYLKGNEGKTYAQKFTNDSDLLKHTNAYGVPNTDSEDWVTYYKDYVSPSDATPIAETSLSAEADNVNHITVWLFNTLRQYTVNLRDSSGTIIKSYTSYYNVRIGSLDNEANNGLGGNYGSDSNGAYLNEYGISGVIGDNDLDTLVPYQNGANYFRYWTFDQGGKYIASTQRLYKFRITANLDLYAQYGVRYPDYDNSMAGLTVSADAPDYYFDGEGTQWAHINTMMNPYNWAAVTPYQEHDNTERDPAISNTAVVYIQDRTGTNYFENNIVSNPTKMTALKNKIQTDLLDSYTTEYTGATGQSYIFYAILTDGTGDDEKDFYACSLVYDVKPAGSATGQNDVYLTNKNRLQFANEFRLTSLIMYKQLFAIGCMKYNGVWKFSDNYVKYNLDSETGKVKDGADAPVFTKGFNG